MEKYDLVPIRKSDCGSIKNIADECFGSNYLTVSQIAKTLELPGVFLKVVHQKQILGFCFALWNKEVAELNNRNLNYTIDNAALPYGIIKTIAIKPNFQQLGFGTSLILAAIEKMKTLYGATVFFYLAWTESKSFNFTVKLKKFGFKNVEIIPNYWYDESIKLNYGCIRCGNPPCNCSLTLFKLTI
ncbi:MAG: GNAT family N-acetyltransferase [Salinivirgaceae bacterium]|jgi:ribosomal protein S18 acetylase RimI-like enzyme